MAVGSSNARQFRDLFGYSIPFAATVNFASAADGVGETVSVSVPGATLGDFVLIAPSLDLQDMILTGYVSAANTVELRLQNEGAATVDLASQTVRGVVLQPGGAFGGL